MNLFKPDPSVLYTSPAITLHLFCRISINRDYYFLFYKFSQVIRYFILKLMFNMQYATPPPLDLVLGSVNVGIAEIYKVLIIFYTFMPVDCETALAARQGRGVGSNEKYVKVFHSQVVPQMYKRR